jgi:hypothetical protein
MAFTLRNALRKQKGGMIGVTIEGVKKWFEEDDFMELFEKAGTKGELIDAIKYGRDPYTKPKADISEPRDQKPPEPPEPPVWDETEPEAVFNKAQHDKAISSPIPPKPTDEQLAQTETPRQQIEKKATTSPYGREEEVEDITPENFPIFKKRTDEAFNQYMDKKYFFMKTLHPKDAAKREIADKEEEWFNEFTQRQGLRGSMEYELLDDYKRDKDPEMKEFLYEWQQFYTKNKEAVYEYTNRQYFDIEQKRKNEYSQYGIDMAAKHDEMREQAKAEREEAKKYTPENRVKDMKALAKAKRNLTGAKAEDDQPEVVALTAEIELLEERLGEKGTTEKAESEGGTSGFRKEAEMIALLKEKGYPPEEITRILSSKELRAAIEKARGK